MDIQELMKKEAELSRLINDVNKDTTPEELKDLAQKVFDYSEEEEDVGHQFMDALAWHMLEALGFEEAVKLMRTSRKWYC